MRPRSPASITRSYKRLWPSARRANAHKDDPTSFGGFSLRSPGEPNGIFGQITNCASRRPVPLQQQTSRSPTRSTCCCSARSMPPQLSTVVAGETWPVMPFPVQQLDRAIPEQDHRAVPGLIDAMNGVDPHGRTSNARRHRRAGLDPRFAS